MLSILFKIKVLQSDTSLTFQHIVLLFILKAIELIEYFIDQVEFNFSATFNRF